MDENKSSDAIKTAVDSVLDFAKPTALAVMLCASALSGCVSTPDNSQEVGTTEKAQNNSQEISEADIAQMRAAAVESTIEDYREQGFSVRLATEEKDSEAIAQVKAVAEQMGVDSTNLNLVISSNNESKQGQYRDSGNVVMLHESVIERDDKDFLEGIVAHEIGHSVIGTQSIINGTRQYYNTLDKNCSATEMDLIDTLEMKSGTSDLATNLLEAFGNSTDEIRETFDKREAQGKDSLSETCLNEGVVAGMQNLTEAYKDVEYVADEAAVNRGFGEELLHARDTFVEEAVKEWKEEKEGPKDLVSLIGKLYDNVVEFFAGDDKQGELRTYPEQAESINNIIDRMEGRGIDVPPLSENTQEYLDKVSDKEKNDATPDSAKQGASTEPEKSTANLGDVLEAKGNPLAEVSGDMKQQDVSAEIVASSARSSDAQKPSGVGLS
jgi:hypothetical protein